MGFNSYEQVCTLRPCVNLSFFECSRELPRFSQEAAPLSHSNGEFFKNILQQISCLICYVLIKRCSHSLNIANKQYTIIEKGYMCIYSACQVTLQLHFYPLNLFLVLPIQSWVSIKMQLVGFSPIPLDVSNTCLLERTLARGSCQILPDMIKSVAITYAITLFYCVSDVCVLIFIIYFGFSLSYSSLTITMNQYRKIWFNRKISASRLLSQYVSSLVESYELYLHSRS